MRLVTFFHHTGGAPRIGVAGGDGIVEVAAEAAARGLELPFDPGDMVSLISAGDPGLAAVRELANAPRSPALPVKGVHLAAPLRPRNIFCVGWNYLEHFAEGEAWRQKKEELPAYPVFFGKATSALNGPFDPIPFDARVSEQIDWEAELAVVVGASCKNVSEADALRHVFGYTCVNDVSARDLQRRHGGQWLKGKSLDGSCPMGPVLVTADELDPGDLRIGSRVNGVVKQDSRTRHMYFKIPRLLAELSLGQTLSPGDVLSTGTPPGVGFGRTPPEYLKPGDVLETEIEGIGVMRNVVGG